MTTTNRPVLPKPWNADEPTSVRYRWAVPPDCEEAVCLYDNRNMNGRLYVNLEKWSVVDQRWNVITGSEGNAGTFEDALRMAEKLWKARAGFRRVWVLEGSDGDAASTEWRELDRQIFESKDTEEWQLPAPVPAKLGVKSARWRMLAVGEGIMGLPPVAPPVTTNIP